MKASALGILAFASSGCGAPVQPTLPPAPSPPIVTPIAAPQSACDLPPSPASMKLERTSVEMLAPATCSRAQDATRIRAVSSVKS